MKAKTLKLTKEEERMIEGLRKSGSTAYETALKNGIPVTVLKGNNVCQVQPNGTTTIVSKLAITGNRKSSGLKFKVK